MCACIDIYFFWFLFLFFGCGGEGVYKFMSKMNSIRHLILKIGQISTRYNKHSKHLFPSFYRFLGAGRREGV